MWERDGSSPNCVEEFLATVNTYNYLSVKNQLTVHSVLFKRDGSGSGSVSLVSFSVMVGQGQAGSENKCEKVKLVMCRHAGL